MDELIFKLLVFWTGSKKFHVQFAIWMDDGQKICEKLALVVEEVVDFGIFAKLTRMMSKRKVNCLFQNAGLFLQDGFYRVHYNSA